MGSTNAQILHSVTTEVQEGKFDMILHVGDFAYNMDNDNGRNGDVFMKVSRLRYQRSSMGPFEKQHF